MFELLTTEQMARADQLTIADGTSGYALMQAAGQAVADFLRQRWSLRPVLVLCGPGNNGGDGYVIAQRLRAAGWPVHLASLTDTSLLKGDAALAEADWQGQVLTPAAIDWSVPQLIVDALFGAGLSRPLEGAGAEIVAQVNQLGLPVIAVDVPSGLDGNTGRVRGASIDALHTVTFFRAKPGHYLHPGKRLCGEVHIRNIGIPARTLTEIVPNTFLNEPDLWCKVFPKPDEKAHKYARGAAYVLCGGPFESGAARLGAMAALRSGAGIVKMLCPGAAMQVNACHLTEVMLQRADSAADISEILSDGRITSLLAGPGLGVGQITREKVLAALRHKERVVLDADALSSFQDDPEMLFSALRAEDVLTPHPGEFTRLFGDLLVETGDRLSAVRLAARRAGCVVLLKGDDTVIATPSGQTAINANGSPWLATAGSGDVLAGIIAGLVAQGMPSFEATCASVWLHAEAGHLSGPGTIAGDLVEGLPNVLGQL
ncbi:NAD(P)H-hydrate dehydratase [Parvularcula sp. IMCC14364]|uniref:NAD(P)H-hydrate dehydratase n=1 Tax=Parvularcula sp. IMCC14364 TaxID=3067902 RepID=UPI002741874E|nr:NAD(P)H-hydrate dehydratase [Parvularcula sp. IMCC14364]